MAAKQKIHTIDESSKIIGSRSCSEVYFSELAMKYFNLGFHYVREVCIKFTVNKALTMEEFA